MRRGSIAIIGTMLPLEVFCLFSRLQSKHAAVTQRSSEVASINSLNVRFVLINNCFDSGFDHSISTVWQALQSCIKQLRAIVGAFVPFGRDIESFVLCHMYR